MRPILLAHGIAPYDRIFANLGIHGYFKGLPEHLEKHGFTVERAQVDFAGSVSLRAEQLADQASGLLVRTGADKAHIIAHSMGGLDARHMLVDFGMADRVASLTTVAAPHLGTSAADVVLAGGGSEFVSAMAALGIDLTGLADLRRDRCEAFNQRAQSDEARNPVRYIVVSSTQARAQVFEPLRVTWDIIAAREGANDGLVSEVSQQWVGRLEDGAVSKPVTRRAFPFPADHLNETGWWDPRELADTPWWKLWRFQTIREIRRFEKAVKDVYLDLARGATLHD